MMESLIPNQAKAKEINQDLIIKRQNLRKKLYAKLLSQNNSNKSLNKNNHK